VVSTEYRCLHCGAWALDLDPPAEATRDR
jgi:DNA-directed RNA polymerase subunit RPC12/RpoP